MQLTQCKSEHTGDRIYLDELGHKYPSISRLSNFFWNQYGFFKWRKQVGYAEAERIKIEAATRGTAIHRAIELNEPPGDEDLDKYFRQYQQHVAPYLEIIHQEIVLSHTTSTNLRMAGTCDLIAKWKGELVIGDYKTSEKVKSARYMGKYALQLAAYSISFESHTDTGVIFNIAPDQVAVFSIPLALPKQILLEHVLPGFYDFYRQPEPRGYANQFRGMGALLDQYERQLADQVTVE